MAFDPNAPAPPGSGVFGLPFTEAEALVVLLPVPWEATTSYGGGAAQGPRAIRDASMQVDLYDLDVEKPYAPGIHMLAESPRIVAMNEEAKALAQRIIAADEDEVGVLRRREAQRGAREDPDDASPRRDGATLAGHAHVLDLQDRRAPFGLRKRHVAITINARHGF